MSAAGIDVTRCGALVVAVHLCLVVTVGVCDFIPLDPVHGYRRTFQHAPLRGYEVRSFPRYRRLMSRTSVILKSSTRAGILPLSRETSNIFSQVRKRSRPQYPDSRRIHGVSEKLRSPPRILSPSDPRQLTEHRLSNAVRPNLYRSSSSALARSVKKLKVWSYDDTGANKVGPRGWYRAFPNCGHRFQSPIDLSYSHFQYRPMAPIVMTSLDYSGLSGITFSNDGFTATIKPLRKSIFIVCDDLPGRFVLSGIHFHWGRTDYSGSEHLVDGHSFPLEMHLVAYNSDYESLEEAEGKDNGVHTVAIFFELSETHNLGLDFCVESLKNIQTPGTEYRGPVFNVTQLFPAPGLPYYRYLGSLTTPPCTENIIWSVFAVPQVISRQQLDRFRDLGLSTEPNPYVGGNVRPLQPLDDRIIYTNDIQYKK